MISGAASNSGGILRQTLLELLRALVAVAAGLLLGASLTAIAGENPLNILAILFRSAFGTPWDFGMSLFYATPLIFTGLSVAIAFRAGLFNIGAEGQLTLGALAAAVVGVTATGVAAPWSLFLAVLAAMSAGFLWGGIAGVLKATRGSHEVITTIMLNFVAAGIASFVTLEMFRNTETQNPETLPVAASFALKPLTMFEGAPTTVAFFWGIAAAGVVAFLLFKSVWGFGVRAVGQSEPAALVAGINVRRVQITAMAVAGAVAGLAGLGEVLGSAGRFRLGFSADYGFMGIAVALLARGRPFAVILAAILFGALHKGAADLDFETENVTRDLAVVLQASVIIMVCADGVWDAIRDGLRRRRSTAIRAESAG